VFPSKGKTGHAVELHSSWERINLENRHVHDLRPALASYMATKDQVPHVTSKMLGHKDVQSTSVYTSPNLGTVREGLDAINHHWQDLLSRLRLPAPPLIEAKQEVSAPGDKQTQVYAEALQLVLKEMEAKRLIKSENTGALN